MAWVGVALAVAATANAFAPNRMIAGAGGPGPRAKLVSVSAALLFTHVRCAVGPSAKEADNAHACVRLRHGRTLTR